MPHFLMKHNAEKVKYPTELMFIQGRNVLFHIIISMAPTFGGVSLHMLSQMAQK